MKSGFDRVAWCYDSLAKFIFGKAIHQSTIHHLACLTSTDKVLIVGGGTGRILEILNCQNIDYVESSAKMIAGARARQTNVPTEFICEDVLHFSPTASYDVIICPFVLDVFPRNKLNQVVTHLSAMMKPTGRLYVVDFQKTGNLYHSFLIWAMHSFFRIFSDMKSTHLLPIHEVVSANGFREIEVSHFYSKMIFSRIYQKQETF